MAVSIGSQVLCQNVQSWTMATYEAAIVANDGYVYEVGPDDCDKRYCCDKEEGATCARGRPCPRYAFRAGGEDILFGPLEYSLRRLFT